MNKVKRSNKTTILSVALICVSVLIILASTLAFFTDRRETTNNVSFGKIEINVDERQMQAIALDDALPGDKITDKISFSKSETSESMNVRAKWFLAQIVRDLRLRH